MKNNKFYIQLAKNNIKRNLRNFIPFWISCMTVVVFFFNLSNLREVLLNASGVYGNNTLAGFLEFGTWLVAILSTIFIFYSNSFLMRNRKKELALYGILGLGKKHIAKVLLLETLFLSFTSILSGLIVGIVFAKLFFLIMKRLIVYEIGVEYGIYHYSVIISIIFFSLIFLTVLIFNLISVHLTEPIELLKSKHIGEKKVGFLIPRFLIGTFSLVAGYYIAVSVRNPIKAISMFFLAVLLVVVGTHFLFLAGSVVVLKLLKKNKGFYYKPSNFISTSSLIYRMKKNAVGLANICILSCMVIVTVATTASVYGENSRNLNRRFPRDYYITRRLGKEDLGVQREELIQAARETQVEIINDYSSRKQELFVKDVNGNFEHANFNNYLSNEKEEVRYITVVTQEDYEKITGRNLETRLTDNKVLLVGRKLEEDITQIRLFHKNYEVVGCIDDDFESVSQAPGLIESMVKSHLMIVSDLKLMFDLYEGAVVEENIYFDVQGREEEIEIFESVMRQRNKSGIPLQIKENDKIEIYSLTGGLYFVGIFLGSLFLLLTVLIIYFKQVSEGEEDRERFSILQKVGLSEKEAGKVIRKQLIMMFFLPLVTTFIHVSVATVILSRILMLSFGILLSNIVMYMAVTLLIFSFIYFVVYIWTSKIYYNIVYNN